VISCFSISAPVFADPPPGYYTTVDPSSAAALRTTLHAVIDDHTRFPYSSSGTDAWNILELADEDPNNAANVLDVYRNASYVKVGAGNPNYDREHSWPNSYGFPNDGSTNYPYTDCHQLFICNSSYNSSRGNKPYATCSTGCSEQVTDVNDGGGGGSGAYPGNSNWTSGAGATGKWETWIDRRGDVARAQLYMDVRYEGGTHGITGAAEPDLILTDNTSLISASNTGVNESIAYMGLLSVLVQWHTQDPVDDRERERNDVVFGFQGNRNPFIDHPEWVDCLFGAGCNSMNPAAPTGLAATPGDALVMLDWNDNGDADLDGYNVYRAPVVTGPFSQINAGLVASSMYVDSTVVNGATYFYRVTAVDTDANESAPGVTVSATPSAGGGSGGTPWINEIHYDNAGADADEGVEIAGEAGVDLTGWVLLGYNGATSLLYQTVALSGVIPNQQNGHGTLWFTFGGLQNGSPDGLALVDPTSTVVQFLSYEGAFTAGDGVASSMSSADIGVAEPGVDPLGNSLQLLGTGVQYSDFTWSSPGAHTRGLPNTNQTFSSGPPVPAVGTWGLLCVCGLMLVAGTLFARRRAV
jgi:endonuclease I